MKKITIAIDGFSSTGKSTLAKQLAAYLGYTYVDTGAMYRAVTYYAMQHDFINTTSFDKENLIDSLKDIRLHFVFNPEIGYAEMYLNGQNVERQIRTIEVSQFVSQIAEVSEVRSKLVEQQQEFGNTKGVVMDGRDIGTVVFPNAELKLFMTASPQIRAERRYQELIAKGENVSFEAVFENVVTRDAIDTTRSDSPLIKADDAIELDNSHLTREEQFMRVLDLVNQHLK